MKWVPVMELHALLQSDPGNDRFDEVTFRIRVALMARAEVVIRHLDLSKMLPRIFWKD